MAAAAPPGRSADEHRRPTILPGHGPFQLRGDLEQQVLPAVGGGESHSDRQVLAALAERQADRRIAGDVERSGERPASGFAYSCGSSGPTPAACVSGSDVPLNRTSTAAL